MKRPLRDDDVSLMTTDGGNEWASRLGLGYTMMY